MSGKKVDCKTALGPVAALYNSLSSLKMLCKVAQYKGFKVDCGKGLPPETKRLLDQALLLAIMCCCADNPNKYYKKGSSDPILRPQACVNDVLSKANSLVPGGRLIPEVSYDMIKGSPAPIVNSMGQPLRWGTGQMWGALQQLGVLAVSKVRKEARTARSAGEISDEDWDTVNDSPTTRRPDVVAVKEGFQTPSAQNIDRMYEMKFEPDTLGTDQHESYLQILGEGNQSKLKVLTVSRRGCDDKQKQEADELVRSVNQAENYRAEATDKARTQTLMGATAAVGVVAIPVTAVGGAAATTAIGIGGLVGAH